MNIQSLMISAVAIGFSATASFASHSLQNTETDDVAVSLQDIEKDARLAFQKVDVDRSGIIELEEYAAQSYVYAELARFNGYVTVEGNELHHIRLPEGAKQTMSLAERNRISALSRREYYVHAGEDAQIDLDEWIKSRLAIFEQLDRNNDDMIEASELDGYVRAMAKLPSYQA